MIDGSMDQSLGGKTVALRTDVCGITVLYRPWFSSSRCVILIEKLLVHGLSTHEQGDISSADTQPNALHSIPFSLMRLYPSSSDAPWLVCSLVCASCDPIHQQGLRFAPASFPASSATKLAGPRRSDPQAPVLLPYGCSARNKARMLDGSSFPL